MAIDRTIDRAWRAVDHIVAALQPGRDELALFTFDTVLREVVPFTTEFDRFDDMTEKGTEKPYGKTSLYDAVADTATLVGQFGSIHHALLVVTDGVDTGSWRTAERSRAWPARSPCRFTCSPWAVRSTRATARAASTAPR